MPLAQLGAEPWPDVELVDMELDAAEVSGGAAGRAASERRAGVPRRRAGAERSIAPWPVLAYGERGGRLFRLACCSPACPASPWKG